MNYFAMMLGFMLGAAVAAFRNRAPANSSNGKSDTAVRQYDRAIDGLLDVVSVVGLVLSFTSGHTFISEMIGAFWVGYKVVRSNSIRQHS